MIRINARLLAAAICLAALPLRPAAAEAPQCTLALFEADAAATLDICAETLRTSGLTNKQRVEALKIRGLALHRLQRLDAAAFEYEQALWLDPSNAEVMVLRGRVASFQGALALAADLASRAAQIDPASGGPFNLMGSIAMDTGRFDAAKAAYEQALVREPDHPLYNYHLFDLLERAKLQREALQQADRLLQLPDALISAPFGIGYEGRRTSFKTAMRLARARLLRHMGRFSESEAALDEVVREAPSVLSYTFRGQFRAIREWPHDQVMADLDRARALDPDYHLLYDVLGRYHFYAKRYEEAAAAFARETELKPEDGEARWWRAMALRGAGRLEDAMAEAIVAVDADASYVVRRKAVKLQRLGYLPSADPEKLTLADLHDAARACMIDPKCW